MSISHKTCRSLIHAAATHMECTDEDAFAFICASAHDGIIRDPEDLSRNFLDGYPPPDWFVDTALDIITGRIPLTDHPVSQE